MANATENRIETMLGSACDGVAPMAAAKTARKGCLALIDVNGRFNPDAPVYCAGVITAPPTLDGYDNSLGANDALDIRFRADGRANFDLDGSATPTTAMIGRPMFAVDDHTVSPQPFAALSAQVRPYVGTLLTVRDSQAEVALDPAFAPPANSLGDYARAPLQTLLAAEVMVINAFQTHYPLVGQGGAVTLSADIPAGFVGQEIEFEGTDDTNTVTIGTGISNVKVAGGVAATLAANGTIRLRYNGTTWNEVARSLNA